MLKQLSLDQFARDDTAAGAVQRWTAFASDLQLGPGECPSMIEVSPRIGNGRPFFVGRVRLDGTIEYYQEYGNTHLIIFND